MRHAEPHLSGIGGPAHGTPNLLVERDQPLSVADQPLAVGLEGEALVVALEQLGVEQLLQPLQLLADGRLRQVEDLRGSRHAARLDDGYEGAQQGDVDVASHGDS